MCNSVVGHQKINTNAMSFVHRFMNAVCACPCVCKCVRVAGFCGAETRSACVWRHLVAKNRARSRLEGVRRERFTPHHLVINAVDSLLQGYAGEASCRQP